MELRRALESHEGRIERLSAPQLVVVPEGLNLMKGELKVELEECPISNDVA